MMISSNYLKHYGNISYCLNIKFSLFSFNKQKKNKRILFIELCSNFDRSKHTEKKGESEKIASTLFSIYIYDTYFES